MSQGQLIVASIAAKNYLPRVRVLAASLREQHPELQLQVLLSDQLDGELEPADEPYRLLQLSELGLVAPKQFCFRYDIKQRSSALKPFFLEYLLNQGHRGVLFLDPDMLITGQLSTLLTPLNDCAILLTPHLLQATNGKQGVQRELEILQAGIFNAGVLGVSDGPVARGFLSWWKQRLQRHTQDSVAEGMYYDQRWLDFVPGLFPAVHIVRDPGCNVAHWNLSERRLSLDNETLRVNDQLCRLLHFSGYNPSMPESLSHHAHWVKPAEHEPIRSLMAQYQQLLCTAGEEQASTWVPAWEHFANGVPIAPILREIYAAGSTGESFDDPFACGVQSFFSWLLQPVDFQQPLISHLWDALIRLRPQLQTRWPDHLRKDRMAFFAWTMNEGWKNYAIAPQLRLTGQVARA
jgi:hypothetical protein